MISFCDSKGNTKRFENKLNKVAPRKARTPSPNKTIKKTDKRALELNSLQPAVPRRKKAKVTNTTMATANTSTPFFVETA